MTNQQDTALLPVEQIDREAAATYLAAGVGDYASTTPIMVLTRINSGKIDNHPLVQAFARHRIAAEQAKPSASCEVERVARAIDPIEWKTIDHWWPYRGTANYDDRVDDMRARSMDRARAAIAALSERGVVGEGAERYLSDRFEWAAPGDQQEDAWLVRFCDKDCGEAIFTGPEAERDAWEYWNRYAPSYNLYVFRLAALASGAGDELGASGGKG